MSNSFPEDSLRIQRALEEHGICATVEQCEKVWIRESDDYFAGWLSLPASDEDLWKKLTPYVHHCSCGLMTVKA